MYTHLFEGNNTDAHPDDTDADDLLKDDDLAVTFRNNMGDWSAESPPQTIQRYDTSAIPGDFFCSTDYEEIPSIPKPCCHSVRVNTE